MKRKIHKILGVTLTLVMVLTLAVAFSPIPALASPDEEEWEAFDIPVVGVADDFFMDTAITGMGPFAKAIDGTLYLYVTGLNDLYKSEDDGRTWEATGYTTDLAALVPAVVPPASDIMDIACSSADADILYVAAARHVYKSDEAGDADSWSEVGAISLAAIIAGTVPPAATGEVAWVGTENITSIDVGYIEDDPYVYIGSADPGNDKGDVFYIGDFAFGGQWIQLLVGGAINVHDVYSVNCSPFFEDDTEVDALVTDGTPYTAVLRNTTSVVGDWSEQAELQLTGVTPFEADWSTDIHYVADFDEEDEMFVGVIEVTVGGLGDVFRVCGVGCSLDLGIDDDIIGLDVVGGFGSTSMVAGTFGTPASIWYTTNDGDDWDETDKVPTGTGATSNLVILDDDFADSGTAWCASDAATEGAVSLTTDFGASWNGISMIDTDMGGAVNDVAFSADYGSGDAPLFMVSQASGAAGAARSVWEYDGTNWERVWEDVAGSNLDLVEVSPDYANDTAVFIANSAGPVILYSHDGGAEFTEMTEQPPQDIASWVVIDDETIITGSDGSGGTAGEVYKTTRYGRRCWDEIDTGGGVITDLAVSGDTVLAGDAASLVFISTDLGEEWDELSDSDIAGLVGAVGDTYVAFDADYANNDTIYVASDNTIGRCVIDPDEDVGDLEFDDMGALDGFAAASGLVASEDGTLYAADATAVDGAVTPAAAVNADQFAIVDLAGGAGGTITVTSGSVVCGGTSTGVIPAVVITPALGPTAWTTLVVGETITVTANTADAKGVWTVAVAGAAVAGISVDDDSDASVSAGPGAFSLPDIAAGVVVGDATGGVNRCLNPTDDTADIEWELPLDGFGAGGQTLAGIGAANTVSSLTLLPGSNILYAIDTAAAPEDIYTYEDTLAAPVILTSPANASSVDSEDEVSFVWEALNEDTVTNYQIELNEYDDFTGPELGDLLVEDETDWSTGAGALEAGTTYYWRVTVTDPVSSRTSAEWSFTTKVGAAAAPTGITPGAGADDVILRPAFSWRGISGAATYEIEVSDNAGFSPVVASAAPVINAWQIDVELDYSTTYYWRVRGVSSSGAPAGDWTIAVFTTMAKAEAAPAPVEVTTVPAPDVTVTVPVTEITPAWIWAIIAIGAVLCIAVIILIVRTRRVV